MDNFLKLFLCCQASASMGLRIIDNSLRFESGLRVVTHSSSECVLPMLRSSCTIENPLCYSITRGLMIYCHILLVISLHHKSKDCQISPSSQQSPHFIPGLEAPRNQQQTRRRLPASDADTVRRTPGEVNPSSMLTCYRSLVFK